MWQTKVISTISVLTLTGMASAVDLLVPTQYTSIQQGINAAVDGDRVLIDAGVYYETIEFLGKGITVAGATGVAGDTIIDGNVSLGAVVAFVSGETSTSILEALTVRHGSQNTGAGITVIGASPIIRNCIVTDNQSSGAGAGIYVDTGAITLEDVIIQNNISGNSGGGIYLKFSSGSMTGGSIDNNSATNGGGLYSKDSTGTFAISGVTIQGNTATTNGGGIYNKNSVLSVLDSSIDLNSATRGGGWFSYLNGDGTVTDSFFNDNSATHSGGAANLRNNSTVSFIRCEFNANVADSDCDGVGAGAVTDGASSFITLEDPLICLNVLCTVVDTFSGSAPTIVGVISECNILLGACCGGTSCWEMLSADCLAGGGVFNGEGSLCADVTCASSNAGGCCIGDTCVLSATEADCLASGGLFYGVSVQCVDVVCAASCAADLNGDGSVEVNDILELIFAWGVCP